MVGSGKANIVIVDDEEYICSIIEEALASEQYHTVSFSDPAEALRHIEQNPIDLVLSDLMMGEYSGIQVLETTLANHSDASVIMMTAHPTVQTAISVLKKGAYDFLVKPFKLEILRTTIRRGLDHQQIVRENLQLKGQVEFLKVAGAAGSDVGIDDFLRMVAQSCMKEMSAAAVGIIEVDPKTQEPVRKVSEGSDERLRTSVLDSITLDKFLYSRSRKPTIQSRPYQENGQSQTRIFVSQPIYARRKLHGMINVLVQTKFDKLTPGQFDALTILATSAASAITNYQLYRDLRTSYLQAIGGLANAIEARDEYTAGHTDRVSQIAEAVARHLKWDDKEIDALLVGCTLHDIGKIGVPDSILNKPGKLTDEERVRMQSHPEVGLMIIDSIEIFKPAYPYVIAHHEWFDGSGYPNGLAGEDIPIGGRLLAVADCFDAIMSDRPYRKGATILQASSELLKFKGIQFDPDLVEVFLEVLGRGLIDVGSMYRRDYDLTEIDQARAAISEKEPA